MSKDSYWFKHDSNASRDLKMLRVRSIYGWEGVGVFWGLIELMREQKNYRLPFTENDKRDIAYSLNIENGRLKTIIFDLIKIELFKEENETLFSISLLKRMKEWEKQKKNGKKNGKDKEAKSKPNRSQIEAKDEPNGGRRGDKIREDYIIYVDFINKVCSKKYRSSESVLKKFAARIKEGYGIDDFKKAVLAASKDSYHIENQRKHLTPEFFTRQEKLDKFMNFTVVDRIDKLPILPTDVFEGTEAAPPTYPND